MAGQTGDCLRAPGRSVGVPLVDPFRHHPGAGRRRHRDRARRARHGGRRAGGLPRRHGRSHHGGNGEHRQLHPGRAAPARLLVLVHSRGRRHARPPRGRLSLPGSGARRPPFRHRHVAPGARAVPRRGAEPRHQADGAGGRRPTRSRWPGCWPSSDAPTTSSWPRSSIRPPTPSGRSRRRCRRRPGPSATAEFWRAVQQGGALPDTPAVAYQVPERMGDLVVVDEAFVEAAHRSGKAVHVWTVNDAAAMERLVGLGVDGIISDRADDACRRCSATSECGLGRPLAERGRQGSKAGSAPPAVRLLAVVGLLLGPEFALYRPLRHRRPC